MSRLYTFLLGMGTGVALLLAVNSYHLVRANDGVHLVPKQPRRLGETYVDIRGFTWNDWSSHAQLASALVQANQQQLISNSAAETVQQTVKQALPKWPKVQ